MRGLHGVYQEEREEGNEFSIDVELEGDFSKAITTDAIEDSVDIEQVATLVRDINRQQQFHLIESFADAIGRSLLRRFPILSRVVVRVTKLTLVRLEWSAARPRKLRCADHDCPDRLYRFWSESWQSKKTDRAGDQDIE